ncbi:MAG: thiol peroxidase [Syntrophobacteraceae bacterium]|jgi:thiol peroxidase|nr:thiol peroxidase [Syntrophobacteraceae bacterium]
MTIAERKGATHFKGNPLTLLGPELKVGEKAPAFTLRRGLAPDSAYTLASDAGKIRLFNVVPSLDTPICDLQTRRFNSEAGKLGDKVVIVTASMDLPPAQERWCQAASVQNLITASDYFDHSFGLGMGLRIAELGVLARAVVILDGQGVVKYIQVVPEVTQEPDYEGVLSALQSILG